MDRHALHERRALGPAAEEDPRVVPAQSCGLLVNDREHAIDGSLHLGDDRSVKIKSLEAAKIMKIKWLVLGCIEAGFCK